MLSAKSKFCFQSTASRWGVCVLLIPLLILSGLSFDTYVTHVHADGALHTHVSRGLAVNDAENHADHHGHEHRHVPSDPHKGSVQPDCGNPGEPLCCCAADPVSTVIVSSAGHLIRQGRSTAKTWGDDLNPALCGGYPLLTTVNAPHHRSDSPWVSAPLSVRVVCRAVLLI